MEHQEKQRFICSKEGFDPAIEFEKDGVITTLSGKQTAAKIISINYNNMLSSKKGKQNERTE